MNEDTADMLFETLGVLDKHTARLNSLDKRSVDQTSKIKSITASLEKQIEESSKDILLQLIENNTNSNEQLVSDITNAIASNIAKLSINAGNVSVSVDTDPIAKAISKLPINNTNNVVVDTTALDKSNKQVISSVNTLTTNIVDSLTTMKVMFQELVKQDKLVKPVEVRVDKEPPITGMTVKRNKDGMIDSIEFTR